MTQFSDGFSRQFDLRQGDIGVPLPANDPAPHRAALVDMFRWWHPTKDWWLQKAISIFGAFYSGDFVGISLFDWDGVQAHAANRLYFSWWDLRSIAKANRPDQFALYSTGPGTPPDGTVKIVSGHYLLTYMYGFKRTISFQGGLHINVS